MKIVTVLESTIKQLIDVKDFNEEGEFRDEFDNGSDITLAFQVFKRLMIMEEFSERGRLSQKIKSEKEGREDKISTAVSNQVSRFEKPSKVEKELEVKNSKLDYYNDGVVVDSLKSLLFKPLDFKFIGTPVAGVFIPGLTKLEPSGITFVDFKGYDQKDVKIRECVEKGNVFFDEQRVVSTDKFVINESEVALGKKQQSRREYNQNRWLKVKARWAALKVLKRNNPEKYNALKGELSDYELNLAIKRGGLKLNLE
jgi:predicted Holliday junction resolvase-like endonuclease